MEALDELAWEFNLALPFEVLELSEGCLSSGGCLELRLLAEEALVVFFSDDALRLRLAGDRGTKGGTRFGSRNANGPSDEERVR